MGACSVEPNGGLNALRGTAIERSEAGVIDLVILIIEHIGVVS
jgi:hypothetical protein